jgi:very-short-patch-repair endonuclease
VARGVYAVGRPQLSQYGRWMTAILSCGPDAVLSHGTAAALWEIRPSKDRSIHLSLPRARYPRPGSVFVHRRSLAEDDACRRHGLPVTTPICTLIDMAVRLDRDSLEAAINEADKLNLVDPERLRSALGQVGRRPGVGVLREVLDYRTFTLTQSQLERMLLPIARRAGLDKPATSVWVHGFLVDFLWQELGLVVETDGLRYHRTPQQQARDRVRDQSLTATGLTVLRFTRAQVRYEPEYVKGKLRQVAEQLRERVAGMRRR